MSTDDAPVYHACENGHPVLEGSTVCTRCGAQVTDRVVKGPRPSRVRAATSASKDQAASTTPPSRKALAVPISLAIGIGVVAAASVFAFSATSNSPSNGTDIPGSSGFLTACGGIAQAEIGLDSEYPQSHTIVCFTVDEDTTITIGATASGDDDLTLEIRRDDGTFWAADDDTYGYDPEVTSVFLPGTYVATVGLFGGGSPGAFTLYTRSGSATSSSSDDGGDLPDASACGTPGTPLLVGSGELALDSDTPYACVRIDQAGFVKFGASTSPSNTADLRLAVYSYQEVSGSPTFIRSVDDTFGRDPETSLALDAGLYLVEVDTWDETPVGAFDLYVDTTETYFRQGEVAPQFSSVRAQECTDGTLQSIAVGETLFLPTGENPMVCLTLDATTRLELAAISTSEEDLTLEIIGFTADGSPVRYGWVDYDPWASFVEDLAQVDLALPQGTYVLAAAQYGGSPPQGDISFTVIPSGD